MNSSSKHLTTVEVVGPAGRCVINESDLQEYQRKGYKLLSEVPKSKAKADEPEKSFPEKKHGHK